MNRELWIERAELVRESEGKCTSRVPPEGHSRHWSGTSRAGDAELFIFSEASSVSSRVELRSLRTPTIQPVPEGANDLLSFGVG